MSKRKKTCLNLNAFPAREGLARRVFFDTLNAQDKLILERRGYQPVILRSLPRGTVEENRAYLEALLCGLEDGTLYRSKEVMIAAKLDMASRGLLDKQDTRTNVGILVSGTLDEVKELWNWNESRHTLTGNTTIVPPEQIVATLQRAGETGKKK